MKQTINFYQFCRGFEEMNRNENFSYDGKKALFEHLEQYEDDTDTEVEFDVIALCCEYTEYEDIAEFQKDYGEEYENMEAVEDNTIVIPVKGDRFIIQAF